MIDDVPILKASQTRLDQFLFDARPNLGREMTAAASEEIGVLLDEDRRIGVAKNGAITDHLHSSFLIDCCRLLSWCRLRCDPPVFAGSAAAGHE